MITSILGAITALGAIFTSIMQLVKLLKSTPEQNKEAIDKKIDDEEKQVMKTGRPA